MESPALMSKEEVREFAAVRTNNAVLWNCIKAHDYGHLTWEQAMQAAAITLSQSSDLLKAELIKTKSLETPF